MIGLIHLTKKGRKQLHKKQAQAEASECAHDDSGQDTTTTVCSDLVDLEDIIRSGRPDEPGPSECCGMSCGKRCHWNIYEEESQLYDGAVARYRKEISTSCETTQAGPVTTEQLADAIKAGEQHRDVLRYQKQRATNKRRKKKSNNSESRLGPDLAVGMKTSTCLPADGIGMDQHSVEVQLTTSVSKSEIEQDGLAYVYSALLSQGFVPPATFKSMTGSDQDTGISNTAAYKVLGAPRFVDHFQGPTIDATATLTNPEEKKRSISGPLMKISLEIPRATEAYSPSSDACGHQQWQPGHHVDVFTANPSAQVNRLLRRLRLGGEEGSNEEKMIELKAVSPLSSPSWLPQNAPLPPFVLFSYFVDISTPATITPALFRALSSHAADPLECEVLAVIGSLKYQSSGTAAPPSFRDAVLGEKLWSLPLLLEAFPSVDIPVGQLLTLTAPLRSRAFSIAGGDGDGADIDLIVRVARNYLRSRGDVVSGDLCPCPDISTTITGVQAIAILRQRAINILLAENSSACTAIPYFTGQCAGALLGEDNTSAEKSDADVCTSHAMPWIRPPWLGTPTASPYPSSLWEESSRSDVMTLFVAAGSGIAPIRALMQRRMQACQKMYQKQKKNNMENINVLKHHSDVSLTFPLPPTRRGADAEKTATTFPFSALFHASRDERCEVGEKERSMSQSTFGIEWSREWRQWVEAGAVDVVIPCPSYVSASVQSLSVADAVAPLLRSWLKVLGEEEEHLWPKEIQLVFCGPSAVKVSTMAAISDVLDDDSMRRKQTFTRPSVTIIEESWGCVGSSVL